MVMLYAVLHRCVMLYFYMVRIIYISLFHRCSRSVAFGLFIFLILLSCFAELDCCGVVGCCRGGLFSGRNKSKAKQRGAQEMLDYCKLAYENGGC